MWFDFKIEMQPRKVLMLFICQWIIIFVVLAYLDVFGMSNVRKLYPNWIFKEQVKCNTNIVDTVELKMLKKELKSRRGHDLNFTKQERGKMIIQVTTEGRQNIRKTREKLNEDRRSQIIQDINCDKIFQGDEKLISKFNNKLPKSLPSDKTILEHTKNCELFRQVYGYNDITNTQEEKDFPIAFNILFYKEVAQVEMLLRSIYRPQNSYCLHVDGFSSVLVHRAARSLADCFPNVFIVSKTENIVYESFQRLQADINCMADHLKLENGWKYLINLPGEEFPTKTNLETVRILKLLNNTNSIECIKHRTISYRYTKKIIYHYETNGAYRIIRTNTSNPSPPHNITIIKGSAYGVFTRRFVHYIVHNQTAKDLLKWCHGILSPDEYFWSMLQYNPHLKVPGMMQGGIRTKTVLQTYVNWGYDKCHGRYLHDICILTLGDLKLIKTRKEIFANKFKFNESFSALQCLEEWIVKKTHSAQTIDPAAYRKWLGFEKIKRVKTP